MTADDLPLPPLPLEKMGFDRASSHYGSDHMEAYARAAQRLAIEAAGKTEPVAEVVALVEYSDGMHAEVEYFACPAPDVGTKLYLHPSPSNSVMVEADMREVFERDHLGPLNDKRYADGDRKYVDPAVEREWFYWQAFWPIIARQLRTASSGEDVAQEERDPLEARAAQLVIESRRASISNVQRVLRIGYNHAARLLEALEKQGIVSAMKADGTREVIAADAARGAGAK